MPTCRIGGSGGPEARHAHSITVPRVLAFSQHPHPTPCRVGADHRRISEAPPLGPHVGGGLSNFRFLAQAKGSHQMSAQRSGPHGCVGVPLQERCAEGWRGVGNGPWVRRRLNGAKAFHPRGQYSKVFTRYEELRPEYHVLRVLTAWIQQPRPDGPAEDRGDDDWSSENELDLGWDGLP